MNGAPDTHTSPQWTEDPTRYGKTQGSMDYYNKSYQASSPQNANIYQKGAKWKLHLNVPDNRSDPFVREIVNFLHTRQDIQSFKVDVGDEEFLKNGNQPVDNGMTIYVGSHADAVKIAQEISSKFSGRLQEFKDGESSANDMYVLPGISMRFDAKGYAYPLDAQGKRQSYEKYGAAGISELSANPVRFYNPMIGRTPYIYPFENNAQYIDNYKAIAKLNIEKIIDEFGDYFLGDGCTEKYHVSGKDINALPDWARDWCELKWRDLSSNKVTPQAERSQQNTIPVQPVIEAAAQSPENIQETPPQTKKTDTTDQEKKRISFTKALVTAGAAGYAYLAATATNRSKNPRAGLIIVSNHLPDC